MAAVTLEDQYSGAFYSRETQAGVKNADAPRFKVGYLTLAATADDGDTTTVNIWKEWGMTKAMAIDGMTHSTTDSVVIEEDPTTAVTGPLLTITVGGSTDNKKRFFVVYGI